jgi:hypothetical protein
MARLPRYFERMYDIDLTAAQLGVYGAESNELPAMLAMALTTSGHNLEDFLDPAILADAYRAAYRLMFIRAMTDVLRRDFSSATMRASANNNSRRTRSYSNPSSLTLLKASWLLFPSLQWLCFGSLSFTQRTESFAVTQVCVFQFYRTMADGVGAIAAVMSLTAEHASLLSSLEDLDCSSTMYLRHTLKDRRFRLTQKALQRQ